MSKHTLGPWFVGNRHVRGGVFSANGELVAATHGSFRNFDRDGQIAEQDANAQLISMSPCMLDALVYARRFLNERDHDTGYIDSVIAKAKGNQQ